jgi:serine/threonine-protein kinase
VPSLTQLAAVSPAPEPEIRRPLQTDMVGLEKTLVRPSEHNGVPAVGAPAVAPALVAVPAPVSAPPARSAGLTMAIGALAAVGLLALGGGAVWYFMPRPQPQAPVIVTTPQVVAPPVVAQPTPMPPPAPTPPPPPPAPPVAEPPVAELARPPPQEPPVDVTPPRAGTTKKPGSKPARTPGQLTPNDIAAAMRPHHGKLQQCVREHRDALTQSTESMIVSVVESSGAVSDTQITGAKPIPDPLVQCLKTAMGKVTFPNDAQRPKMKIQLPFVLKR